MAYGIKVMPYGATTTQTELTDFGTLSAFQRETPEPKVVKVDIPAGLDLDITEAVGPVGWHDGTDAFDIYITTETEAERLEAMRDLTALLHGKRLRYRLSWDSAYYCNGRFTVQYERLNPHVSRASVTIDREAWRTGVSRETHVVDCHPNGEQPLEDSMRYRNVRVTLLQGGGADVAATEPATLTTRTAGTHVIADDARDGSTVWLEVDDWVYYVDGEDLVVKPSRISVSGSNAAIDGSYTDAGGTTVLGGWSIVDGDLQYELYPLQQVTVDFFRWDV